MIFNDIFDIEIDKINNNNRPIVTGEITKKVASIYATILFTLIQILNITFLPFSLQQITNFIIFITFIYTPILKKIPIIKNISCALLVSFSVIFNGLSIIYKNSKINDKNLILLLITTKLIFFGSLYNELLLDISDIKGDRENNIYTIPVIFGNKISWNFAYFILIFNFLINSIFINYLYNYFSGIILLFICSILVNDLYNVKLNNYSKNIIKDTVNNTTKPLFCLLLYLCILSNRIK
jgi:geranylgeranylglycerol-phosphate geranylgeranyltransferase